MECKKTLYRSYPRAEEAYIMLRYDVCIMGYHMGDPEDHGSGAYVMLGHDVCIIGMNRHNPKITCGIDPCIYMAV